MAASLFWIFGVCLSSAMGLLCLRRVAVAAVVVIVVDDFIIFPMHFLLGNI